MFLLPVIYIYNNNKIVKFIYSVDATNTECLGRYVNDSSVPNCIVKVNVHDGVPHLCIYALSDIQCGLELRYNYGVPGLCWRKKVYVHLCDFYHNRIFLML